MALKKHSVKIIGRREFVDLPELNIFHTEAKIDTGAYTCAIHCKHIDLIKKEGTEILMVKFLDDSIFNFSDFTQKKIKSTSGEMEERYIIKTIFHIGRKKINTTVSLTDRGGMRYPILIGRRLLKGKFIVDVNLIYTNGIKTQNNLSSITNNKK